MWVSGGKNLKLGKCDNCEWDSNNKEIKIISNETNKERIINTEKNDLDGCQFIGYKPVPLPLGLKKPDCPLPPRIHK